jgi:hypothetical protein
MLWVRAGLDDPDDDRMPVPSRLDHDLDRLADRGEPTEPPSLSLLLPNVLDGTVIGSNMKRHRHQEFICFLEDIDAQAPKRKAIHAIVDNYATHKHPKVRRWLSSEPSGRAAWTRESGRPDHPPPQKLEPFVAHCGD